MHCQAAVGEKGLAVHTCMLHLFFWFLKYGAANRQCNCIVYWMTASFTYKLQPNKIWNLLRSCQQLLYDERMFWSLFYFQHADIHVLCRNLNIGVHVICVHVSSVMMRLFCGISYPRSSESAVMHMPVFVIQYIQCCQIIMSVVHVAVLSSDLLVDCWLSVTNQCNCSHRDLVYVSLSIDLAVTLSSVNQIMLSFVNLVILTLSWPCELFNLVMTLSFVNLVMTLWFIHLVMTLWFIHLVMTLWFIHLFTTLWFIHLFTTVSFVSPCHDLVVYSPCHDLVVYSPCHDLMVYSPFHDLVICLTLSWPCGLFTFSWPCRMLTLSWPCGLFTLSWPCHLFNLVTTLSSV
jgi:hypothetical protein